MKRILLLIIGTFLFVLFTRFSTTMENHELTVHNIEALTKGENTDTPPDCVVEEGRCRIGNTTHRGMTLKN